MVRSWYWRSPHFFREEAYYFHIVGGPGFAEAFALENEMTEAGPDAVKGFHFCFERPDWFAPGDLDRYRVWVSREPHGLALQEEDADESFVCACQL